MEFDSLLVPLIFIALLALACVLFIAAWGSVFGHDLAMC